MTKSAPVKIGNAMKDGTIYADISPATGRAMYAAPADAPLTMNFNDAAEYAAKLNREKYLGHDDWRMPTKAELKLLFNNRAAIGGFNVCYDRGDLEASWYWSSTLGRYGNEAEAQWFVYGVQSKRATFREMSLRCVRS